MLKELPIDGSARETPMIDLHYWTTPNGHKITIFLEETGTPYKIFPVNIGKGEQFTREFLAISPNNRIPAMVDHDPPDGGAPLQVFESGAILVYLAEKTGRFLPADIRGRTDRSEEHTSELPSHHDLVCRLLLEKKKIEVQRTGTHNSKHIKRYNQNRKYAT